MHICRDEWHLDGYEGFVLINPHIRNFIIINNIKAVKISFSEICFKKEIDKSITRYSIADTSYPMIVTKANNPENKKYRMIDGRNRIHKLIEQGHDSGWFYIVPKAVVMKNLVRSTK
jgi:hypothetical protein